MREVITPGDREADRIYAFCVSGLGHDDVVVEPAEPEVGFFDKFVFCNTCETDLSDYAFYNKEI